MVERLVNVDCQEVLSAAMVAACVRLMVYFLRMIVSYATVAMVFCRLFVFPTVFVSCVMIASHGAGVFVG